MRAVRSCGVLVFRRHPELSFLLMRHPHRYDLPKGHVDPGESDEECALREMSEETGLSAGDVRMVPGFRFETVYYPRYRKGTEVVAKTVVIFAGWLDADRPIVPTEHPGYEWVAWPPPRLFGNGTIDGALAAAAALFADG